MIARLLIAPLGIWKVKKKCNSNARFVNRVARLLYGFYQHEYNSSVSWKAKFGSEPCFPHGMKGVFVSGAAVIGKNCVIFQQVTIGSVVVPDSKGIGAPVLGDNVYIGAGAKIVGAVVVGNNVRIGANAVVYQDVPDNSVVVSGKQRTITRDEPLDNRYYSFHGEWVYFDDGEYKPVTDDNVLAMLRKPWSKQKDSER